MKKVYLVLSLKQIRAIARIAENHSRHCRNGRIDGRATVVLESEVLTGEYDGQIDSNRLTVDGQDLNSLVYGK